MSFGTIDLIHLNSHFAAGSAQRLSCEFQADAWNSTISFDAGIPVALGGTLNLLHPGSGHEAESVERIVSLTGSA